jgi:hypothetical protein
MPEQELNLVQLPACRVAKAGTAAAQIMRCKRGNAGDCRILPNDVPHRLLNHAGTPGPASFVDSAKHSAARDVCSASPPNESFSDCTRATTKGIGQCQPEEAQGRTAARDFACQWRRTLSSELTPRVKLYTQNVLKHGRFCWDP